MEVLIFLGFVWVGVWWLLFRKSIFGLEAAVDATQYATGSHWDRFLNDLETTQAEQMPDKTEQAREFLNSSRQTIAARYGKMVLQEAVPQQDADEAFSRVWNNICRLSDARFGEDATRMALILEGYERD